jgi:hypothetical protein
MAPQGVSQPPAGGGGAATTCGDNIVQPTETCERGQIPASMTCEAMYGKGATGLVMCTQCKIDFSMCVPPKTMGTGGSGASVVGGSGAVVGAGGTGR